ncbi:hypothetical protein DPMN_005252 [Dreissena polymorpha]|uniref:Uncharacterized protein n=1 Tax=Dreissena polymorpha TaxID=45954 RepID=A0A9D4RWN1_DREPO|nr:hypothetical protein DPMN_005252 [Dreissena polymorpha]
MHTAVTSTTTHYNQTPCSLLQNDHRPEADDESSSILKEEMDEAMRSLKAKKISWSEQSPFRAY